MVLAPITIDIIHQNVPAVHLALTGNITAKGRGKRHPYMDIIRVTICIGEIIPEEAGMASLAWFSKLEFRKQPVTLWSLLHTQTHRDRNNHRSKLH